MYLIRENDVEIDGKHVVFDYPITDHLKIGNMLIVRSSAPPKDNFHENVFGLSLFEGKVTWQIAKLKYATGSQCPFIDIMVWKGKLRLNNWCDVYLIVDPATGKIL